MYLCFREPEEKRAHSIEQESEDEMDKMDRERREDLDERDAFAKRIVEKDKDKQRTIMSKSDKKVNNDFYFYL